MRSSSSRTDQALSAARRRVLRKRLHAPPLIALALITTFVLLHERISSNGSPSGQTPSALIRVAHIPLRPLCPVEVFGMILAFFFNGQLSTNPYILTGSKWRFSPFASLRTLWRRKKDADYCDPEGAIRTWCGEDQSRCTSIPNDEQPQAGIQHRRIRVPPGNYTLRRWNL
jgi:hypothetical protein